MLYFLRLFLLLPFISLAQSNELTYNEYLGYVKKFHPLVKQAELQLTQAQAELMVARGGFDPKIEANFDQKEFKNKNYYTQFNSSFKIPTWYGIEFKASFDTNEGLYTNPQNTIPSQGLFSLGVNVPLGQGLFIDNRMATLRNAKLGLTLNKAQRDLQALEVLVQASVSYFNWKKAHQEASLYQKYYENAQQRKQGILKLIQQGDKPAMDSIEATITVHTRALNKEEAQLKLLKSKLEVSNFLWANDNIPLEMSDELYPEQNLEQTIKNTLKYEMTSLFDSSKHPKIKILQAKLEMLEVERKLKANLLLPKFNVSYNYIAQPQNISNFNVNNYKLGVQFSIPILLRKERGSLKLSELKIQDTEFKIGVETIQLKNKIEAQQQEIISLNKQLLINTQLVNSTDLLLKAEEKLFNLGESSLFLINTRENTLISSKLSEIAQNNRYYNALINYYQLWGNPNL